MRVVLHPMSVRGDCRANLALISARVAASRDAHLVLFPEAALGSFPTGQQAEKDMKRADLIPGPVTEALSETARAHNRWIGIGLLERSGSGVYDSALLIAPDGTLSIHYRRIHHGWFYPTADRSVYRTGRALPVAETPAGRTAMLICGDIFDDEVARRAAALRLDLLLVPMARSLIDGPDGWARELPAYQERLFKIGVSALVVNRSDGAFVGGAMAIDSRGEVRVIEPPGADERPLLIDTHALADTSLGLERGEVRLLEHSEEWLSIGAAECAAMRRNLGPLAVGVEHVGSTAVPGLPAKPILDLVVAVRTAGGLPALTKRLSAAGIQYRGDGGEAGGHLFAREAVSGARTLHIHVVLREDPQWLDYVLFRETLRSNSSVREDYAKLKRTLADRHPHDREAYTAGKGEQIQLILSRARRGGGPSLQGKWLRVRHLARGQGASEV